VLFSARPRPAARNTAPLGATQQFDLSIDGETLRADSRSVCAGSVIGAMTSAGLSALLRPISISGGSRLACYPPQPPARERQRAYALAVR